MIVDARSASTTPRVTVHALGTASRNAEGDSRHPNTRIDAELQAKATYRFPPTGLKEPYPCYVLFKAHLGLKSRLECFARGRA